MGKLAFLFAGQGAQTPGMGKELYEANSAAKDAFDIVEAARPGTLEDCFSGAPEHLAKTSVTQPCVYAVDLAAATALTGAGVQPDGAAGFSLGELAALTFAGVFAPEVGARLVCKRGELMEHAAAANPGGMAAVLRLADEQVEALCAQFQNLWPVNYNCPGQLVVAGDAAALPEFCAAVKEAGGMAKPLPVGGAFHTPFMEEASEQFARLLAETDMAAPRIPVYANRTALPYETPYADTLAAQMRSPVRFTNTILQMGADGFDTFVELGPGKTLSGFVRRILPEAKICNVQDSETLSAALAELQ